MYEQKEKILWLVVCLRFFTVLALFFFFLYIVLNAEQFILNFVLGVLLCDINAGKNLIFF